MEEKTASEKEASHIDDHDGCYYHSWSSTHNHSSAFESVRSVDIVMLFGAGMATGILVATARNYPRLIKDDQ